MTNDEKIQIRDKIVAEVSDKAAGALGFVSCHFVAEVVTKALDIQSPKTVTINGIECVDDWVRSVEDCPAYIYFEDIRATMSFAAASKTHYSDTTLELFIRRGIVHRTAKGASMACKARHTTPDPSVLIVSS